MKGSQVSNQVAGAGGIHNCSRLNRIVCLASKTRTQPLTKSPFTAAKSQTHSAADWVGWVCSGFIALQLSSANLHAEAAVLSPGTSPYLEAQRQVYGPTEDGRVRSCQTNINPNCVSTGSINAAYSPAWFAPEATPSDAADDLERAVLASVQGSEVLQQVTLPSGAEYRAFSAPSLFGQDVLEFVIRPDQPSGQLVTYRSIAGLFLKRVQQQLQADHQAALMQSPGMNKGDASRCAPPAASKRGTQVDVHHQQHRKGGRK